jgi:hypothetical protein
VHLVGFIIRIHHDVRSPERQISETHLAATCVDQATTGITDDSNIQSTKTNGPAVKRRSYQSFMEICPLDLKLLGIAEYTDMMAQVKIKCLRELRNASTNKSRSKLRYLKDKGKK